MDQEQVCNGNKKAHGANYKRIATPDGLIMHLFGPTVSPTNYCTLYGTSHIVDAFKQVARTPDRTQYKIHEDKYYVNLTNEAIKAQFINRQERILIDEKTFLSKSMAVEWSAVE